MSIAHLFSYAVVLLACASGCDMLFQLDSVEPRRDSGNDSGSGADAMDASPGCMTVVFDEFDDNILCQPWANSYGNVGGSAVEMNGQLQIRVNSAAGSDGGCLSKMPLTFSEITVEVPEIVRGSSVFTMLQLHGALEYEIGATGDGVLKFESPTGLIGTTISYDTPAHHWRLSVVEGLLSGQYSVNGETWMNLGSVFIPTPATALIQVTAGVSSGSVVTGAGRFERVVVCP
jgi:hypothetical protein